MILYKSRKIKKRKAVKTLKERTKVLLTLFGKKLKPEKKSKLSELSLSLYKLVRKNALKRRFKLYSIYKKIKFKFRQPYLFHRFRDILKRSSGRNNTGRITVRHRGRSIYRSFIRVPQDFAFSDVTSKIVNEHRFGIYNTTLICGVNAAGVMHYLFSPEKLKRERYIYKSNTNYTRYMSFTPGTCINLELITTGAEIYNVELYPGSGAQIARAAGCKAKVMMKKMLKGKRYAGITLPSKKLIYVPLQCQAFLGAASNSQHKLNSIGLAGKKRKRGFRPAVRGVAMNPVDHPHGGGEGKSSAGRKLKNFWGKSWLRVKTRSDKKETKFRVFIKKMNRKGLNIFSEKKKY